MLRYVLGFFLSSLRLGAARPSRSSNPGNEGTGVVYWEENSFFDCAPLSAIRFVIFVIEVHMAGVWIYQGNKPAVLLLNLSHFCYKRTLEHPRLTARSGFEKGLTTTLTIYIASFGLDIVLL